jgi:hypothetical protein
MKSHKSKTDRFGCRLPHRQDRPLWHVTRTFSLFGISKVSQAILRISGVFLRMRCRGLSVWGTFRLIFRKFAQRDSNFAHAPAAIQEETL